jgi:hypothetical protein
VRLKAIEVLIRLTCDLGHEEFTNFMDSVSGPALMVCSVNMLQIANVGSVGDLLGVIVLLDNCFLHKGEYKDHVLGAALGAFDQFALVSIIFCFDLHNKSFTFCSILDVGGC